jgi:hypothetical protein
MRSYLQERDKARNDGDKLATLVQAYLKGKSDKADLCLALMAYCKAQGWNGPACSMVHDIIDYEESG